MFKRRSQYSRISRETSIVYDILNREIKIYTDAGRVQRPLFVTEEGSTDSKGKRINRLRIKPHHIERLELDINDPNRLTFNDLVKEGLIDFLDVEEEETAMIAMF